MGLADNNDSPRLFGSDSGRGLQFMLYQQFTTAVVQVSSTVGGDPIVIDSFTVEAHKVDGDMTAEGFAEECDRWRGKVDDAALRELRVKAGAYPLIRTTWDGQRCKVSVTVSGIGAASGVVGVAEKAASSVTMSLGMVEVDRIEGQRTGEGITYGFVFEHFDQVNAAKGVTVEAVNPAEFRCGSRSHKDTEVPAAVRVTAPVPGKRELVSLTACHPCWAWAVVEGLGLDQFDTNPAMLTLYHRTTKVAAEAIVKTGRFNSREQGRVYFSNRKAGDYVVDYGEAAVCIVVPQVLAQIDDQFDDGERHYWVSARNIKPEWITGVA